MIKKVPKLMAYLTKKVIKIPLTVITLTNVPNSLRGDLSKWMQEIATGVYVGNFNTKVREKLWDRILENVRDGQATISYSYRNEIGYKFETTNTKREAIDYEGLPLVLIRKEQDLTYEKDYKKGFSKAAKFRKAHKFSQNKQVVSNEQRKSFVVIDLETDGLDYRKNKIIEIGAVKISQGNTEYFQSLINTGESIPKEISKLTKIDERMLKEKGKKLEDSLEDLLKFIGDYPLVGYNLNFDIMFLNRALKKLGKDQLRNKKYDLLTYVKKEKKFLPSYKLSNVLKEYDIKEEPPHRALEDARLTYKLSNKVEKFLEDLNKE